MPSLIKGFPSKNLGMFLNIEKKKKNPLLNVLRGDSSLIVSLHLRVNQPSPRVSASHMGDCKTDMLPFSQAGAVWG